MVQSSSHHEDVLLTPLWQLITTSRFYSVPYLTSATLSAALLGGAEQSGAIWAALLVPSSFALGIAALNDLAHLAADQRSGRMRTSDRAWLVRVGIGGSLLALGAAALGGGAMLGGVVASLVIGLAYAKAKSLPLFANLLRGLTTSALLLGAVAMGGDWATGSLFALGMGLLDSAGNLWGDWRDRALDQRAGTRTFATVAPQFTPIAALLIQAASLFLLSRFGWWLWLSLVPSLFLARSAVALSHLRFLQMKMILTLLIGLTIAPSPLYQALYLGLGLLTIPATWIYRTIHNPLPTTH